MTPMNNPMFAIINAMRSGGNPYVFLSQMAKSNPQIAQAMQMIQGKSPQQLKEMAYNMAKESGVNISDVARSLGINIPNK